jgi:DNA-binding NarL/FixJ family response regulator
MPRPCGPILVVDEAEADRDFVRALVRHDGHSVVEAATGEDALAIAGEQNPCLVVLDVTLPGISGYEVCRQLRATFGEELPIMFVSGTRTDPHDRVAGLLLGADDYLAKPFLPDELLARIRRLLVRSRPGPTRASSTRLGRLTGREQEVLTLLARGLTQRAIAAELFISPKTVSTHIQRLLAKLDARSRAEAVAIAYRDGLVSSAADGDGETALVQ